MSLKRNISAVLVLSVFITSNSFATDEIKCEGDNVIFVDCQLDDLKQQVIGNGIFAAAQKEAIGQLTPSYFALENGATVIKKAECSSGSIVLKGAYVYVSTSCSAEVKYNSESKVTVQSIQINAKARYENQYESYIAKIESVSLKETSK